MDTDDLNNVLSQLPGHNALCPLLYEGCMLETVLAMNMNEYVD